MALSSRSTRHLARCAFLIATLLASAGTAAAQDSDGDGYLDAADNCPEVAQLDQADADSDGVGDVCDNCIEAPNGPDAQWGMCDNQQDADGDGYGNACDTDINNNGATDSTDFGLIQTAFLQGSQDPLYDVNCNGATDGSDYGEALDAFLSFTEVGPSGLDCAGETPCPPGVIGTPLPSEIYDLVSDSETQVSGSVTQCTFTSAETSPTMCDQTVLVYPLMAKMEEDPPLQELPVTLVQISGEPDYGTWIATGLAPGTIYGFYAKNHSSVALPETTAIGSPMHHATPGVPMTLPDSSSGYELAGATELSTGVSPGGTAQIDVPLRLPPGTAGMRPELSLSYDSGAGNGPLGVGWALTGLSRVTRCGTTIGQDGFVDPVDFDGNDRFCWDGQRLVPMTAGGYWNGDGSEYRAEIDSMAKIIANGSVGDGPSSFTVWTRDGRILTFAEQGLREPTKGVGVHTWALSKVEDRYGNYYTVEYHNNETLGELWPVGLDYTGKDGASPSTPYAGVDLIYESRPDPIDGFYGAVRTRFSQRLAQVDTFTDGQTVTSYWLEYDDDPDARSRLESVTECGYDDMGQAHCLRPTLFDWEPVESITATTHAKPAGAPSSFYPPVIGELDGEGTLDVAIQDDNASQTFVYLSPSVALTQSPAPSPDFSVPHMVLFGHTGNPSSYAQLRSGDFNGNGRHGLVSWDSGTGNLRLFNEIDGAAPTQADGFTGLHLGSVLHVRDFTGDGVDDLLLWNPSAGELIIYPVANADIDVSNPTTSLSSFEVSDDDPQGYPQSTRLHLGDFNGDGVTDLLLVAFREDETQYYKDGAIYLVQNGVVGAAPSSLIPLLWDAGPTNVGDFNGDGTSDLVTLNSTNVYVRLVSNGRVESGIATPFAMPILPSPIAGDFDGDGTDDLLVLSAEDSTFNTVRNGALGSTVAAPLPSDVFLDEKLVADLTGNGLPDLLLHEPDLGFNGTSSLLEVAGNAGDRVRAVYTGLVGESPAGGGDAVGARSFSYSPRSDSSLYTTADGLPASFFNGAAAYLVASASVEAPVGTHSLDYVYESAGFDRARQEALGLRAWQETDTTTGRAARRILHQGFPLTGLAELEELMVSTGQVIRRFDYVWATTTASGSPSPLLYLEETTETAWELGEPSPYQIITDEVLDLDPWGNVAGERRTSDDGWVTEAARTYSNDPAVWLLGLLATESISDSNTPLGLTESRVAHVTQRDPATGRRLRVEIEPGESFALTTAYAYDTWGNLQTTTEDPDFVYGAPRVTTTQFGSRGQFPELAINALGHQTTFSYEARHGGMLSTIDPNGVATSSRFDPLGRQVRTSRDGSVGSLVEYEHCAASCPAGTAISTVQAATDGSVTVVHADALGRELRTERLGFDGTPIFVDQSYNVAGELESHSLPTYAGDPPPLTTFTYDPAGRVKTTTDPSQEVLTHAYDGRSTTSTRSKGELAQTTTRAADSRGNLVGKR